MNGRVGASKRLMLVKIGYGCNYVGLCFLGWSLFRGK